MLLDNTVSWVTARASSLQNTGTDASTTLWGIHGNGKVRRAEDQRAEKVGFMGRGCSPPSS